MARASFSSSDTDKSWEGGARVSSGSGSKKIGGKNATSFHMDYSSFAPFTKPGLETRGK